MPQPATARLLLAELCAFVAETVAGYPFPSPEGTVQDCRVFLHGLPEGQEEGTWPFIVCRFVDGEVTSEADGKTVLKDTVALILGVHSPVSQAQAGLLLAELLDLLRAALWRERLLAGRFELEEPLRARVADMEQKVHQFHLATLETTWNYVWPPKGLLHSPHPRVPATEWRRVSAVPVATKEATGIDSRDARDSGSLASGAALAALRCAAAGVPAGGSA